MQLYLRFLSIHFRSQLQYRVSFALDVVGTFFVTFVYFITLAAVFTRFRSIGGWTLGEVAFLYGQVELAFGLMDMIFSGFDPDFFSMQIRRGVFDQMLLRPLGLFQQIFSSEFLLRRLGRILQGVVILGASLALAPIVWTPAKIFYLPVVILSTVVFFGGLFVIGAALCFWTVQPVEAINILTYGGSELLSYPTHIYTDWLRRFFTFVVPGAVLVYYPALYFLDKPDPTHLPHFMPFLAPLAGFGVLGAAWAFWSVGVRHYTSTGT